MNCYVYRTDAKYDRDASCVRKTQDFALPLRRTRQGDYKLAPGTLVYTCFTSDFLLDSADEWRKDAWQMIDERRDLTFFFITKRIDRLESQLPPNWGDGYDNVIIGCTCENRAMAQYRLPIFLSLPIKGRIIINEPLLEGIDLSPYLSKDIERVVVGGESGNGARPCRYEWVTDIRRQCSEAGVPFYFKQTGANFVKDGKSYSIPRKLQHAQAKKANIDIPSENPML